MPEPPSPGPAPPIEPEDRLDSWKEIAAYLRRDVTTVQRWEKREGMPVHRHLHDRIGSVYALRAELDEWARSRRIPPAGPASMRPEPEPKTADGPVARWPRVRVLAAVAAVVALATGALLWRLQATDMLWRNPIARAQFTEVTDWDGVEQAAVVSRDGSFAAFLADRDGRADVWVTQVGTGQFHNLTADAGRELVNPSIRTLGFSPDGALVTFWTRNRSGASSSDIAIWAVPILGGQPRPYLEGVAEYDWSSDGSRLVYHTPGPGDPMFVREAQGSARQIFAAAPGLHAHFPLWSPDQSFIYFVQGSLPDRMDIWRLQPTGGAPERITHHESRVSHPVFLDQRTLVYLATESSGAGPWLYSIDVEKRRARRVSSGVDTFASLAASADGRRLVATLATTKTTLWRLPGSGGTFDPSAARRIPLTTGRGSSPRLGPGYLLYVSTQGSSDSLWKEQGDAATQLWTAPDAKILGGPAIDGDGRRIAFTVRRSGQALLYAINSDGTGTRVVARSLEWEGAPAWTPDGRSITAAALDGGVPRLFNVPLDGRPPAVLGHDEGLAPAWSPDGRFVVFSGPDIGTTFPVRAIRTDGGPYALRDLTLTRGARHVRFWPGGRALVVLRGEIRHKDLWSIDLETGAERQLTRLPPDFEVGDFDVSPDGGEVVLERAQARSDIVLLDMPPR